MDPKPGAFTSPEAIADVADAGAGSVGDLIRMTKAEGTTFTATGEEVAAMGAGFHQDVFKTALGIEDPGPTTSASIVSISNEVEAVVTVDPAVAATFTAGSTVHFDGTGNATLDAPQADYYVLANDGVTFTVNADLSGETAPITQGTVALVQ